MEPAMKKDDTFKNASRERIIELIDEFCPDTNRKQQAFAEMCGVSKFSISQYVNGTNAPGNMTAAKIANKCNVDPLWVMGFDVPKHPVEKTQQHTYYTDDEAAEMLQDIFDNSYIHALFMAAKGSKPEDVRMVTEMLNRFKGTNPDG